MGFGEWDPECLRLTDGPIDISRSLCGQWGRIDLLRDVMGPVCPTHRSHGHFIHLCNHRPHHQEMTINA